MTLDDREMLILSEATKATVERIEIEVQNILDDIDQEAAANGNLWLQGRITGLQSVLDLLAEARKNGEERLP